MKYLSHWLTLGIATTFTMSSWAATVVEQRDAQGNMQKVTIEKAFARMEGFKPELYMLVDFQAKKMYMVNTKEQKAVENNMNSEGAAMPPGMKQPQSPPEVEAKLVKIGDGPEIAGYATVHYQVTANGEVCSNDYFSESADKIEYIHSFSEMMDGFRKKTMKAMPFMPANPCLHAYSKLQPEFLKHGTVLRSTAKDGKVMNEVVSIKTSVEIAPDLLKIPEGYKIMTEKELMEQMRQRFENMQRNQGGQSPGMPGMMPPQSNQPQQPPSNQ